MTAGRTNHTKFAGLRGSDVPAPVAVVKPLTRCASDQDGDCTHAQCPQLRDGEPKATGRSCPLYNWDREDL